MSTFLQFFLDGFKSGRSVYPPQAVIVVSGESAALVNVTLDELLFKLKVPSDGITLFYADETPPNAVLVRLGHFPPFDVPQAVVYYDVDKLPAGSLDMFLEYAKKPTTWTRQARPTDDLDGWRQRTTLILVSTAGTGRGGRREGRWLPTLKTDTSVLYVDCNEQNSSNLVKHVHRWGLHQGDGEMDRRMDASWLVEHCGNNPNDVMRNMDLLSILPQDDRENSEWSSIQVERVFSRVERDRLRFDRYEIIDNGNDVSLCTQLRTRIQQFLLLSIHMPLVPPGKEAWRELILRAEMQQHIYYYTWKMVKGTDPRDWLDKLALVTEAEYYARRGAEGVREYLASFL